MKRIISLILIFVIVLSLSPSVYADGEVLLFSDDLESAYTLVTSKWKATSGNVYLETKNGNPKKCLHIKDESLTQASIVTLKNKIDVTAGETYTLCADAYCYDTYIFAYVRFYNSSGTIIENAVYEIDYGTVWRSILLYAKAPSGAVSCDITFASNRAEIGSGYIDNIMFYKGVKSKRTSMELIAPEQADPVKARIIGQRCGHLEYNEYNAQGDKLGDFSFAGYKAGEYEIPDTKNLPVATVITPHDDPSSDAKWLIQNEIDRYKNNDSASTAMKVIKLKAGVYTIKQQLIIGSGIVLQGEGQGPNGTVIKVDMAPGRSAINFSGNDPSVLTSVNAYITDDYIKSGSYTFSIPSERVKDYEIGDMIEVNIVPTDEWCNEMKMTGETFTNLNIGEWQNGENYGDLYHKLEKTITKIEGNKITVDIPFYVPVYKSLQTPFIRKINDSQRKKNAGIENLRVESIYDGSPVDENHAEYGITFSNASDCYARDVTLKYFGTGGFTFGIGAKRITVKNCSVYEPISQIKGGRRYPFYANVNSQQILVSGCYAYDGRHDYLASRACNGIVFLDSVSDMSNQGSETHGNFSNGVLYDNILHVGSKTDGFIAFTNRGNQGTTLSQGWTSAGTVAWNCLSPLIFGAKPPLNYQNFIIGQWGYYNNDYSKSTARGNAVAQSSYYLESGGVKAPDGLSYVADGTSMAGNCYMESKNNPVEPRSLFKAQLAERLSGDSRRVKPNAPVITYPRGEDVLESGAVTVKGMFQKGASYVKIYVDGEPHNATLNRNNFTFTLNLNLSEGTHRIYATQVISGVESTKCADRFVSIGSIGPNESYLQSEYEYDKIHLITGDASVSYDLFLTDNIVSRAAPMTVFPCDTINLNINNITLADSATEVTNGKILVPLRSVFEALDGNVTYNPLDETATIKAGDKVIVIKNMSDVAKVNDDVVTMDAPAIVENNRFLVPVRFITDTLDADLDWDSRTRTINIKGGAVVYPPIHNLKNELGIYKATQTLDDGKGSSISNLFDGTDASWDACIYRGEVVGILDFGGIKKFKDMYVSFKEGTERIYKFDVLVSYDGEFYKSVIDSATSSGTTENFEKFPLDVTGRYIKIIGRGNNKGTWCKFKEMAFTKAAE